MCRLDGCAEYGVTIGFLRAGLSPSDAERAQIPTESPCGFLGTCGGQVTLPENAVLCGKATWAYMSPSKCFLLETEEGKLSLCVNMSLLLLMGHFLLPFGATPGVFHKSDFQFKEAPGWRSGRTETDLWAEVESGKMNFPLEGSQGPRVSWTSHQPEKK